MRVKCIASITSVVIGTLFSAGLTLADSDEVPIPELPPLTCKTESFQVEAVKGPSGEFPKAATCGGEVCALYQYKISSAKFNIDYTVIAVSATQQLFMTFPQATVAELGDGDSGTGFLKHAEHEYAVRFKSSHSKSVEASLYIKGRSKARITSVLIRGGHKPSDSCLIAGPGVQVDQFEPVPLSQAVSVAGGKCVANLIYDAAGVLIDVTTDTPGCIAGQPANGIVLVNNEPLHNNISPLGITFGNGTTTCYGPPVPSIPRCICTKAPCP